MVFVIQLHQASVSYPNGHCALNGLSFSCAEGERVAVLGANGAGKTTLMLALAGLVPLTAGWVEVGDARLEKKTLPLIRQRLGFVFQNPESQLFCATVYDDLAFGLRNRGIGEVEIAARLAPLIASFRLEKVARRASQHLSAGEKRRAALAAVLACEPKTLLLDEPSSLLDPPGRRALIALLQSLPVGQWIATHDFELARALCSRAILLRNGTLAAAGDTETLLADAALLRQVGLA